MKSCKGNGVNDLRSWGRISVVKKLHGPKSKAYISGLDPIPLAPLYRFTGLEHSFFGLDSPGGSSLSSPVSAS